MKEPTEMEKPSNRQEERDRMGKYAQELSASKGDKELTERQHTLWEDIGLAEYKRETGIWECRIDDCEAKMETSKRISHHRKTPPGTILRTRQTRRDMSVLQQDTERDGEIIHPYGSKAARRKLAH